MAPGRPVQLLSSRCNTGRVAWKLQKHQVLMCRSKIRIYITYRVRNPPPPPLPSPLSSPLLRLPYAEIACFVKTWDLHANFSTLCLHTPYFINTFDIYHSISLSSLVLAGGQKVSGKQDMLSLFPRALFN